LPSIWKSTRSPCTMPDSRDIFKIMPLVYLGTSPQSSVSSTVLSILKDILVLFLYVIKSCFDFKIKNWWPLRHLPSFLFFDLLYDFAFLECERREHILDGLGDFCALCFGIGVLGRADKSDFLGGHNVRFNSGGLIFFDVKGYLPVALDIGSVCLSALAPFTLIPFGCVYESNEPLFGDALVCVLELCAGSLEVDEEHLEVVALGVLLDGLIDAVNDIGTKNGFDGRFDRLSGAGGAGVANEERSERHRVVA
jgi:hypothetical protein